MSKETKLKDQRSNEEIGERLRKLRKEKQGMTCEKLAEELDCDGNLIQKVETGKNALSKALALKYHDYFGVSLDYLFFGVESDRISDFFEVFQGLPETNKKEILKELIYYI